MQHCTSGSGRGGAGSSRTLESLNASKLFEREKVKGGKEREREESSAGRQEEM